MPLPLLFLLCLCLVTPARSSDVNPYADELIAAARQQHLAEDAQWLTLLHYRKRWMGMGHESLVDSANFLTAADGKYNPQAEQESDKSQNPQCRFVARYQWLKQHLGFDAQRLPEQSCPRFERRIAAINPAQVTLIFPAAYLNNPSSMFGHTLLRIDMPQQDERTRIISQEGFLEGSQINFLDLEARYYPTSGEWHAERFTVIDIASLAPRDDFFQPLSWSVSTGMERAPFVVPGEPLSGYLRGGGGQPLLCRARPAYHRNTGGAALHALPRVGRKARLP